MSFQSIRAVRAQDAVWLLLFSALAFFSRKTNPPEIAALVALALFQIAEPRLPQLATARGMAASALLKLGVCYFLIGWTGGISSTYYVILLLPVVSAATTLNLLATLGITALACLAYLSFLLFVDWTRYEFTPEAFSEVGLRVVFLPVVAFVTHQLAEANRVEARRSQAVAAQLEDANRSLRAAEAAVRRADRLAALGQLTAGLAHELRNPIGTIRASAEMLAKQAGGANPVAAELAGFISSEVDRTNSLITRFLDFARPLRLRLETVDLTRVIDGAVAELARHYPGAAVHKNYSLDVPPVSADPELLQRAVYNLLSNAAEASRPGGGITVKTRAAGGSVEIAVIDRGAGIPRENLESVFNPFFTTRADGVGLGLAIVSKIVDEHGGKIDVQSQVGEGSAFRLLLPAGDASAAALRSPAP